MKAERRFLGRPWDPDLKGKARGARRWGCVGGGPSQVRQSRRWGPDFNKAGPTSTVPKGPPIKMGVALELQGVLLLPLPPNSSSPGP